MIVFLFDMTPNLKTFCDSSFQYMKNSPFEGRRQHSCQGDVAVYELESDIRYFLGVVPYFFLKAAIKRLAVL